MQTDTQTGTKPNPNGVTNTRFTSQNTFLLMGSTAGMGLAVAHELVTNGASLILSSRSEERLAETQKQCERLRISRTQSIQTLTLDHSDARSPARLRMFLDAQSSELPSAQKLLTGILVNGGGPHGDTADSLTSEAIEDAHQLLFKGPILHLQEAIPFLCSSSQIVAISSTTVSEPHPTLTLSGAYRSALTSYLKSLSDILAPKQISVNAVAPGFIATEGLSKLLHFESLRLGIPKEEVEKIWASKAPLGRMGRPCEIARLICFLFANQCSFLTGQTLTVDGGQVRSFR